MVFPLTKPWRLGNTFFSARTFRTHRMITCTNNLTEKHSTRFLMLVAILFSGGTLKSVEYTVDKTITLFQY